MDDYIPNSIQRNGTFYENDLLEHLYREVRAPRIYEGATEVQRSLIAKELYRTRA